MVVMVWCMVGEVKMQSVKAEKGQLLIPRCGKLHGRAFTWYGLRFCLFTICS